LVYRDRGIKGSIIIMSIILFGCFFMAGCSMLFMKSAEENVPGTQELESKEPEIEMQETEEQKIEEPEIIVKPLPEIVFSPTEILPGGYFSIFISNVDEGDSIETDTDLVKEKPVFYKYKEGRLAIIGFNSRIKPDTYKFAVKVIRDGEIAAEKHTDVTVVPKEFEKQYLKVSKSQKEQRSEENLNNDSVHTSRAKSETADTPLWQGEFIQPAEGRITTEYAVIRYINDEESGRHGGLDIAAPKGTPVKASNDGVVKLSMLLVVSGNTVIIDHGCNVFTSYIHLDKLLVKEGDIVKKGDIIGEVGSTGFSTGPHLHWSTTIGATYMNPHTFIGHDPLEFIENTAEE
jgi:murein DD-endopeptidase MepM/ murein hydrolase activator NlpD